MVKGLLGILDICHITSWVNLLPGIWDAVFNILISFRDIGYLGKIIMWLFAIL